MYISLFTYIKKKKQSHMYMFSDIDECSDGKDGCSQTCTNTVGSFVCGYNSNYLLDIDGVICIGMQ